MSNLCRKVLIFLNFTLIFCFGYFLNFSVKAAGDQFHLYRSDILNDGCYNGESNLLKNTLSNSFVVCLDLNKRSGQGEDSSLYDKLESVFYYAKQSGIVSENNLQDYISNVLNIFRDAFSGNFPDFRCCFNKVMKDGFLIVECLSFPKNKSGGVFENSFSSFFGKFLNGENKEKFCRFLSDDGNNMQRIFDMVEGKYKPFVLSLGLCPAKFSVVFDFVRGLVVEILRNAEVMSFLELDYKNRLGEAFALGGKYVYNKDVVVNEMNK